MRKPGSCTDVRRILAQEFARRDGKRFSDFTELPSLVLVSNKEKRMGVTLGILGRLKVDVPIYNVIGSSRRQAENLCFGGIRVPVSASNRNFHLVAEVRSRTRQFTVRCRHSLEDERRIRSVLSSVPKVNSAEEGTLLHGFGSIRGVQSTSRGRLTRARDVGTEDTHRICRFFRGS